jgi:DNA polymerase-4
VSIGLSYNKFLAKVASDLNKPRGFSLIGEREAHSFLSERPIGDIMGVGKRLETTLKKDGYSRIKDLQKKDVSVLVNRYGKIGQQLASFSHGIDLRKVNPVSLVKSISTETTFGTDISGLDNLRPIFWKLCEVLSKRIKQQSKSGKVVTVKFKTFDFKTFTRRRTLRGPTQLAEVLYQATFDILSRESKKSYRLLGIGISDLYDEDYADSSDLLDLKLSKTKSIENTMDSIRKKLGDDSIKKGRSLNK